MLLSLARRRPATALSPLMQLSRSMSRTGKMPISIPESVIVKTEPMPLHTLPPFKPYSKRRMLYSLRNRPSRDGFAAFGEPTRVTVEGPLGTLQVPVHSFCRVEQKDGEVTVTPQCGGKTKLGKTMWGTTRGYIANAVRGVTIGFRKELELHGVGFKARVEPIATAASPAGERCVTYRLGLHKYGEKVFHKGPGPPDVPDPVLRGGVVTAGAGGGFRRRQPPLRPPSDGSSKYDGGSALMLRIGMSHECRLDFPNHLSVSTPTQTTIVIQGIDKQQVGLAAARVRLLRKPDAYKGKGVRYAGEKVKLKVGKRK